MQPVRNELMPGVWLTYVSATKFKTGLLSMQFVIPLQEQTASLYALLPAVLRRGTVSYPTMERLEGALDLLYGSRLDCTVRKKGENQCIGFVGSFIEDPYLPQGETLLEPMAQQMGELLLRPVTQDGCFLAEYVDSERDNLVDAIRSSLNDKREYADMRLLQIMCADESYGIHRLGDERTAQTITGSMLYAHYQTLLETGQLELFYSGSAPLERVQTALREALRALPRGSVLAPKRTQPGTPSSEPRFVTERMEVTQAKLSMGLRCGSGNTAALSLCNAVFGGTSNSRLFLHVREKLSLCYFASSQYHRAKGLFTISSGIDSKNYQTAFDEIMAQLSCIGRGELEEWELPVAKRSMMSAYQTLGDSQGRTEDYYLGQAATGREETPEEQLRLLEAVTEDEVAEAARSIALDTVYFLTGKEDAE